MINRKDERLFRKAFNILYLRVCINGFVFTCRLNATRGITIMKLNLYSLIASCFGKCLDNYCAYSHSFAPWMPPLYTMWHSVWAFIHTLCQCHPAYAPSQWSLSTQSSPDVHTVYHFTYSTSWLELTWLDLTWLDLTWVPWTTQSVVATPGLSTTCGNQIT